MAGPAYFSATLSFAKNEDWVMPFVYQDSMGVPIDMTACTLRMEIRKNEADRTAIVNVNSPNNGIVFPYNDPTLGQFVIEITRDRLARLAPGEYVTDLVRLMPSGWQERIWEGTATVVEGTSR